MLGLAEGDIVSVTPADYGKVPVTGSLVTLDIEGGGAACDAQVGAVVTHFPRLGYRIARLRPVLGQRRPHRARPSRAARRMRSKNAHASGSLDQLDHAAGVMIGVDAGEAHARVVPCCTGVMPRAARRARSLSRFWLMTPMCCRPVAPRASKSV